ncbi:MAG: acyl-CoA dehydrogenase [Desulfobacterales bacterium]|nr:acyl-CoA dehydrogenase [Desulfobacterales bacterium]
MAQLIADRHDVDFVLHEQFKVEDLCQHTRYRDFDRPTVDLIVDEGRNLALKEILPTFVPGDREGIIFDGGQVKLPACFYRAYRLYRQGEWIAMAAAPEFGGQGLPCLVAQAVADYQLGANSAFMLFGWGGFGAGEMIETFGSAAQRRLFLSKMYAGQWGGTMVLTESEAGSDVGALTTTARPLPDGSYAITGNKIFITNGEHDLTENIIHPVLARIEGAPAGTRGVSLFIVPKLWVEADGSLGAPNDVVCTGIEAKMGIHASPTCSLAFGSQGQCRGLLLGEVNRGMKVMFHMMNAARLLVGAIGMTSASAAYQYALDHARQRRQGRDLARAFEPDAPQVAIIRHPDVRRMLTWMKVHVAGMRSFVYYGAYLMDRIKCAADEAERDYHQGLLDLLTPVIKAYCSDRGFEVCSQAVQVYGGYGYTRAHPVEQLLRDVRIASIYEGTNGIQALDLLGRKMGLQKGQVFMNFMAEVRTTIDRARGTPGLDALAERVAEALEQLGATALRLGQGALGAPFQAAFAQATPFLEVMGDVIMAWMLLWRAVAARPGIEAHLGDLTGEERRRECARNRQAAFYEGQVQAARYFVNDRLPVSRGKMAAIQNLDDAVITMPDAGFGS